MFLVHHQGQLQKVLEDIKCLGIFEELFFFLKLSQFMKPGGLVVLMHSWADT